MGDLLQNEPGSARKRKRGRRPSGARDTGGVSRCRFSCAPEASLRAGSLSRCVLCLTVREIIKEDTLYTKKAHKRDGAKATTPANSAITDSSPGRGKSMTNANDTDPPATELSHDAAKRLSAVKAWQEERRHKRAALSAKEQRDTYRAQRAAEGKTVRAYKFHDHGPEPGPEGYEARQRRMHRNRQRAYRGISDDSVRQRADLSHMPEEQKLLHKREQAKQRQRRLRARAPSREEFLASLSIEETEELEELLRDLVL